jgi:hypothetical protein
MVWSSAERHAQARRQPVCISCAESLGATRRLLNEALPPGQYTRRWAVAFDSSAVESSASRPCMRGGLNCGCVGRDEESRAVFDAASGALREGRGEGARWCCVLGRGQVLLAAKSRLTRPRLMVMSSRPKPHIRGLTATHCCARRSITDSAFLSPFHSFRMERRRLLVLPRQEHTAETDNVDKTRVPCLHRSPPCVREGRRNCLPRVLVGVRTTVRRRAPDALSLLSAAADDGYATHASPGSRGI